MNYPESIEYLFSRLPMFSRIGPAAFKKDLTNTLALCSHLGDPQNRFRSIHVAGTNGKGSVSHMLAAILQKAGYKTGLYTSPHLEDFRERIRINGEMISEKEVVDFTESIIPLVESIEPSFFEITVAMAFDHFARHQVDIAVIEVGLGGRLDSTNIILPEISVITQIGYDHMNMLGNTLAEIAREKAGIIKPGVPVVIGEKQAETLPIFQEVAHTQQAPLLLAQEEFQVMDHAWKGHELVVDIANPHETDHQKYHLDLTGIYQLKNIIPVLETCRLLREMGWNIHHQVIAEALSQVKRLTGLHGRWDLIHQHPDIILEVAHNEDGIRQMTQHLETLNYRHLHIIIGMVKDKEPERVFPLLPKQARYYFTQAHIPRALEAESLKKEAGTFGLEGHAYPDVNLALAEARDRAGANDLIIVCGSIFLVAEVRR